MADNKQKFLDQTGVQTLWERIKTKLNTTIGEIPEESDAINIIDYINKKTEGVLTDAAFEELQNAVFAIEEDYLTSADKTELKGDITALEAIVNSILENEDEINLNSIAELAKWITDNGGNAAALTSAVQALQTKTTLGTDAEGAEYATVKAYVEATIEALNLSQYAKASEMTALGNRITALEEAEHLTSDDLPTALSADEIDTAIEAAESITE
jgi:hypothetical protein